VIRQSDQRIVAAQEPVLCEQLLIQGPGGGFNRRFRSATLTTADAIEKHRFSGPAG
jgi:hypothetical protein